MYLENVLLFPYVYLGNVYFFLMFIYLEGKDDKDKLII